MYAKAGGYLSYLLYSTSKETPINIKTTIDLKKENINRVDAGAIQGLGATRILGPGFIFIDARYTLGIANLNNSSDIYSLPFGIDLFTTKDCFSMQGTCLN